MIIDGTRTFIGTGGRSFETKRPVVVFLHGAGMDHTAWMLPARAYAHAGWAVLAPDLPGHGRSEGTARANVVDYVPWLEKLLAATGVHKAAVVGHSMGGAIALEAAAALPDRVTHLGLVGTAAAIPVGPALLDAARLTPKKAYAMMTAWSVGPNAKSGPNPMPGVSLTGVVNATFARNRPETLAIDLAACAAWTTGPAAAAKTNCPTAIILGERDMMTPAKRGADLARLIPSATLSILPAVGHMITAEAPNAFLAALQRVIAPHQLALTKLA